MLSHYFTCRQISTISWHQCQIIFTNYPKRWKMGTWVVIIGAHIYHPQRSWGKVIFSEACVKNSVHRRGHLGGGVGGLAGGLQTHTQEGSWGVWLGGGSPGPHPGGGGSPCPHPHWGVYPSMHWGRHTPPADGYCCRRYAFYWNSFLLL